MIKHFVENKEHELIVGSIKDKNYKIFLKLPIVRRFSLQG